MLMISSFYCTAFNVFTIKNSVTVITSICESVRFSTSVGYLGRRSPNITSKWKCFVVDCLSVLIENRTGSINSSELSLFSVTSLDSFLRLKIYTFIYLKICISDLPIVINIWIH